MGGQRKPRHSSQRGTLQNLEVPLAELIILVAGAHINEHMLTFMLHAPLPKLEDVVGKLGGQLLLLPTVFCHPCYLVLLPGSLTWYVQPGTPAKCNQY